MLRGLKNVSASMTGRMDQQDVIANNLANIDTPGYKRRTVGFSNFDSELRAAGGGNSVRQATDLAPGTLIHRDERQGEIQKTGVPTHIALDGPGSFVVQGRAGERRVRGGNFSLDESGRLVSSDGSPVLGRKGEIQIPDGDWTISPEGEVRSGGNTIDQLRIDLSPGETGVAKVVAGSLESSNVNPIEEMVSMISALRTYEACQRTIQSMDQTLDKAINQMGRPL